MVVPIAYDSWSLTRDSNYTDSAITRKVFVFGKDRHLWKGVLTRRCRTWRSS